MEAATLAGIGAALTDIAFAPNGNLYGISFNNLYSINTSTGAATLIGGGFPVQNECPYIQQRGGPLWGGHRE